MSREAESGPGSLSVADAAAGRMPLLHRLRWYRNRLAAMSLPEVLFRFAELARRMATRHHRPRGTSLLRNDAGPLPDLPGLADGVGELAALRSGPLGGWQALADDLGNGRLNLLGRDWPLMDGVPDWHIDPVRGGRWPSDRCGFDVPYRENAALGDVRFAWEVGRLQYLQPVAALALVAEDRRLGLLVERHALDWVRHNPLALGVHWATGLEVALRAFSLLSIVSLLGESMLSPEARQRLTVSLAEHGWWLARFPSRHSSANHHLVAESAALFLLASLLPGLRGAGRWAAQSRATLEIEIRRQFHADGVGAEQSVALAAFSLEWLLLAEAVARRLGPPFSEGYVERLGLAGGFLAGLADANGNRPAIGDDEASRVFGGAQEGAGYVNGVLAALAAVLDRPDLTPVDWQPHLRLAVAGLPPTPAVAQPTGLRHFPQGGYSVARDVDDGHEVLLTLDHGPVGYLSIAAHGDADALSVWLNVEGRPVLVDAGTHLFHQGDGWRSHFRSTSAHNTLTIDGADSSVAAGPFNWSHKAQVEVLGLNDDPAAWWVEAAHDGYALAYGYRHCRRLERLGPGLYQISDRLEGDGGVARVEIGFLLAPNLSVSNVSGGFVVGEPGRRLLFLRHEGPLKGWLEHGLENPVRGWYAPDFGRLVPAPRIVFAGKMWQGVVAKFTLSSRFA